MIIAHIPYNVWTWIISSSTKQRRGEERFGKKKQQLLSKHRAAVDGKNSQKIAALVSLLAETMHPRLSQNIRLTLLFKVKRIK